MRATSATGPTMVAASDGAVQLRLDPDQARALARVLAHYDALVTKPGTPRTAPADGYSAEVWHFTLLELRKGAAIAEWDWVADNDTVEIPLRRFQVVRS